MKSTHSDLRMRSVVELFDDDEDTVDADGERKKGAGQWSAHDVLPLLVLTLCALIAVVLVATGARMHEPTMYDLAAKLLWKNATVRPPVMLFFVVAGWAWVVRLCRSRGMNIDAVLTGKVQPAAATQDAALKLLCMLLLSHLVHLVASETGVLTWRPWFTCNVCLLLCVLALGAMPLRAFHFEARLSLCPYPNPTPTPSPRPSPSHPNQARLSLLRALYDSVTAPLGPVTFWHVIVADYLTSLAKTFGDVQLTACISWSIFRGERGDEHVRTSELWGRHHAACNQSSLNALMLALPFWWRLMQCFKVFSQTGEQKNLWNALKYSTAFPLVYAGYLRKLDAGSGGQDVAQDPSDDWMHDHLFVLAAVAQSSYCFVWDVLMDWGLPERGRPAGDGGGGGGGGVCGWRMRGELLVTRDKALYLVLCAFNLVLRFTWTLTFLGALPGRGGGMFCIEVLEIARRTVWAVFRIEWELVHKGHARAAASESDDLDAEELQPLGEAHSKHLDD